MQTRSIDDFGQEYGFLDISMNAIDAKIRFAIDGKHEGIHAGIIPGDIDEECLAHWGMI